MSVRNYAILWPESRRTATTASGGNQLLSTDQHPLDGAEHSAASDQTRLDATIEAHGLLPKLSGSADDALRGDGTWGVIEGSGNLTNSTGERHVFDEITAGSTETLDLSSANTFDVTLTDDLTLAFSNPPAALDGEGRWTIILRGDFDVTWPASVVWADENGDQTTTVPAMRSGQNTVVITTLDGGTSYGASLENGSNGASGGASASDSGIWRPLLDGATGAVVQDGATGEAIMAFGPA